MSRKTGIVKDTRYLQHSAGFAHPESPERLAAIYEMLDNPLECLEIHSYRTA